MTQDLNTASLKEQLEAVHRNGCAIQFIDYPCLKVQLEAAKTIPDGYVKYTTDPEACKFLKDRLLVENILAA